MISRTLVIIGGGSAGMAAAIKAYDLGVKDILILEKGRVLGGILNQCIHNGFGLQEFQEELTGPEFLARYAAMTQERNIEVWFEHTVLNINANKEITVSSPQGLVIIKAQAIIFTVGCYERSAGAIKLPGDRPKGVITAGQAQYYQNILGQKVGKQVFVLGSGDIGLIMARRLTLEGAKVLGVAEIMPYSNGLNRNIVQCLEDYEIPLYLSHTVTKVIGKERLEKIEISKVDANYQPILGTEKIYEVDTLVLSVGLIPNLEIFNNPKFVTSSTRGLLVDNHFASEIPGIFSAGNCLHVHDLVDFVVKEARIAATNAYHYLQNQNEVSLQEFAVLKAKEMGYLIPEYIRIHQSDTAVTFQFRVRFPILKARIKLLNAKNEVLFQVVRLYLIPSEMVSLEVKAALFLQNSEPLHYEVEVLE
ncbi:MAG: NAD(P)/FAD-dependent oxidoreductase [Erysipelotrichaceae bacterium]|jgi:NADPH-dependent 2,4-dienoyl-CoA reductase/sulfur reductase-like enzyme|nr:NAD(P)/FAD-dependent oxidoreductase [Erysipelotrichaceae bacterium]